MMSNIDTKKAMIFLVASISIIGVVLSLDSRLPTIPVTQIVDTWYNDTPRQIFNITDSVLTILYPRELFVESLSSRNASIQYINSTNISIDGYICINGKCYNSLTDKSVYFSWKVSPQDKISEGYCTTAGSTKYCSDIAASLCMELCGESGLNTPECIPATNSNGVLYKCSDVYYEYLFNNISSISGISVKYDTDSDGLKELYLSLYPEWMYREVLSLDFNNTESLMDVELPVRVDTQSYISNGYMKSDCSDIRFSTLDLVETNSIYIEASNATSNESVWFNDYEIADVNFDGKQDIITVLNDFTGEYALPRIIAFSLGSDGNIKYIFNEKIRIGDGLSYMSIEDLDIDPENNRIVIIGFMSNESRFIPSISKAFIQVFNYNSKGVYLIYSKTFDGAFGRALGMGNIDNDPQPEYVFGIGENNDNIIRILAIDSKSFSTDLNITADFGTGIDIVRDIKIYNKTIYVSGHYRNDTGDYLSIFSIKNGAISDVYSSPFNIFRAVPHNTVVTDLDGDGNNEIVVSYFKYNLDGKSIPALSVFYLNLTEKITKEYNIFNTHLYAGEPLPIDLNLDGKKEIVNLIFADRIYPISPVVMILDYKGNLLDVLGTNSDFLSTYVIYGTIGDFDNDGTVELIGGYSKEYFNNTKIGYTGIFDLKEVEIPYYIESGCGTTNTLIWVKVPQIISKSPKALFLYTGNNNAVSLSDSYKVFDFYDDFEIWTGWTEYGSGIISQDCATFGFCVLKKDRFGDPNGGYKDIGHTVNHSFVLEARIMRDTVTSYCADRIGIIDNNGNGYGINIADCSGNDNLGWDKRSSYTATSTVLVTGFGDVTGNWYRVRMIWNTNGTMIFKVFDDNWNLLASGTATDTSYNQFTRVYVFGGYPYYVDWIRVRKHLGQDIDIGGASIAQVPSILSINSLECNKIIYSTDNEMYEVCTFPLTT